MQSDSSCVTYEEAADLAKSGQHDIHTLTVSEELAHYGFVTATAKDGNSICQDETCYLAPGGQVVLYAVPENQTRFTGWSGCSTSTDPHLTVSADDGDIHCVAHFEAAFTRPQ